MVVADVVVVGAGLAGTSLAWHLARRGLRAVVLDRAGAPGAESSADGVGMVRRLAEDPVERALARRTSAWMRPVLAGDEPDWPDPPGHESGAVLGAADDPTWLADAVAELRAHGVAVHAVDRPGDVSEALVGGTLARAWWLPDEIVVRPPALLAGFVRGAVRGGATIRCGVSATGLRRDGERVVGVDTSAGPIAAGAVVVAAGGWAAAFGRGAGLERPMFPLRRSVWRLSGPPAPQAPWVWLDDVGLYARSTEAEWWVSSCDERVTFPTGVGTRGDGDPEAAERAQARIARWMPGLAGRTITGGWSGLRTFAPDRRPVLGADPERPGLWWLAGLGGSGVTAGPAAGEAVAAWIAGEAPTWLPQAPVAPRRAYPRRWPIRPDGSVARSALIQGTLPTLPSEAP